MFILAVFGLAVFGIIPKVNAPLQSQLLTSPTLSPYDFNHYLTQDSRTWNLEMKQEAPSINGLLASKNLAASHW
jgi:hypothetical protein